MRTAAPLLTLSAARMLPHIVCASLCVFLFPSFDLSLPYSRLRVLFQRRARSKLETWSTLVCVPVCPGANTRSAGAPRTHARTHARNSCHLSALHIAKTHEFMHLQPRQTRRARLESQVLGHPLGAPPFPLSPPQVSSKSETAPSAREATVSPRAQRRARRPLSGTRGPLSEQGRACAARVRLAQGAPNLDCKIHQYATW